MSFRLSHSIKGVDRFIKKVGRLEKDMLERQAAAVRDSIFLIHSNAVQLIQDNSSGTPMVRYTNGRKRNVLVSRPGDAPNTDTGRLVQSIKFDFQNSGLTGRVGTNLRYGAHLEFGTKGMRSRPWLSTAVSNTAKEVGQIFHKHVTAGIKEAGK